MNITGLHILTTYRCNLACPHCFVWGSPTQEGSFTANSLHKILEQAREVPGLKMVFFEGGEPFLDYFLVLEGVSKAHTLGFSTGIVTNGFWATSVLDAEAWLYPLIQAGLDLIQISAGVLHNRVIDPEIQQHPGITAAENLNLQASLIEIDPPPEISPALGVRGMPVTAGGVMFRGRAAHRLTDGMPQKPWNTFTTCPHETLETPKRVHLDPLGFLHLCQGIVMGNVFETPLKNILASYHPDQHSVVDAITCGGPAELIHRYAPVHHETYVDACHLCYDARTNLREQFQTELAPDQMYGLYERT